MKDRVKVAEACLLVVSILTSLSFAAQREVDADPRVQAEIERVVTSIVDSAGSGETAAIHERIRTLEQAVGGDRQALLSQMAIYLAGADGTERSMGAALALDHFDFSSREIVATIAPLLGTEDTGLRRVYCELLGSVDRPNGEGVDFEPYVSYLREAGVDPPEPLVEYLYGVAAPEALSALAEVYVEDPTERESLRRAAHAADCAFNDTTAQLEELSRSDQWWVRLFVRELVDASPEYATEELQARLDSDPHPLVREGPTP